MCAGDDDHLTVLARGGRAPSRLPGRLDSIRLERWEASKPQTEGRGSVGEKPKYKAWNWSGGGSQGAHLGWGRSHLVSPLSC